MTKCERRLQARIQAWKEAKPREDVDAKNAKLLFTNTYHRKLGSENRNK
jgi:hypothetical protein